MHEFFLPPTIDEPRALDHITKWRKTYISIDEIEASVANQSGVTRDYQLFAAMVTRFVQTGLLEPVGRPRNGRQPPLPLKYRIVRNRESEDAPLRAFERKASPHISLSSYKGKPEQFAADRPMLELLSDWFFEHGKKALSEDISINERSYQVFRNEKFLASAEGSRLLQRIGLAACSDLRCYKTFEPFFFSHYCPFHLTKSILIIENLDTWYSLWRHFELGNRSYQGKNIDMLIYGEGQKIEKSLAFIETIGISPEALFLYFGDMDPKGVEIAYRLGVRYGGRLRIEPALALYEALCETNAHNARPLRTQQRLVPEAIEWFLGCFRGATEEAIKHVLKERRYIPQEGLCGQEIRRLFTAHIQED